jgi:hypothetical protein
MRPTQKMKKSVMLPARNGQRPEPPVPREPGAQVAARLELLKRKHQSIRETAGGAKLTQTMTAGQELIRDIAKAVLEGKKVVPPSQPGAGAAPSRPITDRGQAAKIEEAERKALDGWKAVEKDSQERLARRASRVEARLRALAAYQAARARGLGGPKSKPQKPERG